VVEVDPALKDELYVELARRRLTLKAWFVMSAERFLSESRQPALFAAEPDLPGYHASTHGETADEEP